jgi:nitrate reductase (NAD(P)H)
MRRLADVECLRCSSKRADSAQTVEDVSKQRYTLCQVRRHCTAESCWLVAHGKVYDVTAMVKRHPGGQRSILRHAGADSTEDFDFHSKNGRKMCAPETQQHHPNQHPAVAPPPS